MSQTGKISWEEWHPGLDNDGLTLGEVLDTLPGANQEEISKIVRLFENPASPIAFKGAVSLERHDCIHILLGRGLLNQDEAFVIGFTMGTSKAISSMEARMFKLVTEYLYPKPYKFTDNEHTVFDLALERGHECRVEKIYDFPFEEHFDDKLGDLREQIGINKDKLRTVYRKEQELLPDSIASRRLPV